MALSEVLVNYEGFDPLPTLPGIGGVEIDDDIVLDSNSLAFTGVRLSDGTSTVECEIFELPNTLPAHYCFEVYPLDGHDSPILIDVIAHGHSPYGDDVLPAIIKAAFLEAS